jgi:hypothetical protein
MDLREFFNDDSPGKQRLKVGIVALAIVLLFVVVIAIIASLSHHSSPNALSQSATTVTTDTTTTDVGQTDDTTSTSTTIPGPDPQVSPSDGGQGDVMTSDQLAATYPRANSNLSDSEYQKTTQIANAFVTADTTGQGSDQFGYYYGHGGVLDPWLNNLNIEWTFPNQDTAGVIHVKVWYTGNYIHGGAPIVQATQDVYLDMTNNDAVIPVNDLAEHGVTVDQTECCVNIVGNDEDDSDN